MLKQRLMQLRRTSARAWPASSRARRPGRASTSSPRSEDKIDPAAQSFHAPVKIEPTDEPQTAPQATTEAASQSPWAHWDANSSKMRLANGNQFGTRCTASDHPARINALPHLLHRFPRASQLPSRRSPRLTT
ncbi:hypothetical protein V8E36_002678 [Tilletia maclaganii]